tara:strand:+ start:3968 stop:4939 length:972 start_codon:yes stop_codon:yes gene_type:complete
MIKKVKKFFKLNLRAKLESIQSKYKLNIYPQKISYHGLSGYYHKLLFYLSFRESFKQQYKFKYDILFNNKINFSKIKLIMSFPRSGGTFVNSILSSYFEISTGIGDGKPKYMYDVDRLFFTKDAIDIPTDIFSFAKDPLEDVYTENDYINFNYDKPIVAFENNIFYGLNNKQVFLIRDPESACMSYLKYILTIYTHLLEKRDSFDKDIVLKRIDYVINEYIKYINEVEKYKNKKNCLIIKFEDLNAKTSNSIRNIFDYFELEVNDKVLDESIEINLKNNFLDRIYNKKSNRFSKRVFDEKLDIFIKDLLEKRLHDISKRYGKL